MRGLDIAGGPPGCVWTQQDIASILHYKCAMKLIKLDQLLSPAESLTMTYSIGVAFNDNDTNQGEIWLRGWIIPQ